MPADKGQRFLQIGTIILGACDQACPIAQNNKFAISLQYLKNEVSDEVDFLHADKNQSFPQVDFNTLGIKVFYKVMLSLLIGMIKHCRQYRFIASKKKLGMEFIFCMQINIKVSASFIMEVARHIKSTQIGSIFALY